MASPIRIAVRMLAFHSKMFEQALHNGEFDRAKEHLEGMRFWSKRLRELNELYKGLEGIRRTLKQN